jgi:hypothetical protein
MPIDGTQALAITNTLVKQDTGGNLAGPAPVPSLGQWALLLLSIAFAGVAAVGLRRTRLH